MNWLLIGWSIVAPPLGALAWYRATHRADWAAVWSALGAEIALIALLGGIWASALVAALNSVIGSFLWWFNRRRRDRAKALLGAKSRALRDALVRKQREVTRPRPVLRPVPQGGGW